MLPAAGADAGGAHRRHLAADRADARSGRATRANGVPAAALISANTREENERILDELSRGALKLLYLAPERLAGSIGLLRRAGVSLLAVDEAHCVSQWGHDFRPDYLTIGALRQELGGVQTAAFTATADSETRADIAAKLFDAPPLQFLRGFDRPNLFLAFEPKASTRRQDLGLRRRPQGRLRHRLLLDSRRKTEELAEFLSREGFDALPYHAGLAPETAPDESGPLHRARTGLVMTATVAFGMGIDKPDVRFVVHADLPKTIESYYQEIGRAGRDGLPADTLTLYGIDDIKLRRRQIDESDALGRAQAHRSRAAQRAACARRGAALPAPDAARLFQRDERTVRPLRPVQVAARALRRRPQAAQKALSAMVRTGERFGLEHLIAVLRGEENERIAGLGHDRLPTFGVGEDIDKNAWRDIFRQIYALGLAGVDMRLWRLERDGGAAGRCCAAGRGSSSRCRRSARRRSGTTGRQARQAAGGCRCGTPVGAQGEAPRCSPRNRACPPMSSSPTAR